MVACLGLNSPAFMPLWRPEDADGLLPPATIHGVSMIEVPLLNPRSFDSLGIRRAAEHNGVVVVCSLSLPETMGHTANTSDVMAFLDAELQASLEGGSNRLSSVSYGTIGKVSGQPPNDFGP